MGELYNSNDLIILILDYILSNWFFFVLVELKLNEE